MIRLLLILLSFFTALNLQAQLTGFKITSGNIHDSIKGATWTYQATVNAVTYDLQGTLYSPKGDGPFPAIIINHGTGGNVNSYGKVMAKIMVSWGYVCIATNYTHSSNVPCGLPGNCVTTEYGASVSNVQRGMKCWDILASFNYVNTNNIMTFGHSRGAFTTTQLVADFPTKFCAAAHTAGGIVTSSNPLGVKIPLISSASAIITPYMIHHGDDDTITVPVSYDVSLDSLLTARGVTHTFHLYDMCDNQPICGHNEIKEDSLMLSRTRDFFDLHATKSNTVTGVSENHENYFKIFPMPTSTQLTISVPDYVPAEYQLINSMGEIILQGILKTGENTITTEDIPMGFYFIRIKSVNAKTATTQRIVKL